MQLIRVALNVPLGRCFDYQVPADDGVLADEDIGRLVVVPFGRSSAAGQASHRLGVIVALPTESDTPVEKIKTALMIRRDLPTFPADFVRFCAFAARYYQAEWGEMLLAAVPTQLKTMTTGKKPYRPRRTALPSAAADMPTLNREQQQVLTAIVHGQPAEEQSEQQNKQNEQGDANEANRLPLPFTSAFHAHLVFGITGSGKTEIYLRLMAAALQEGRQVLLLVPEINLTPQLEAQLRGRFGEQNIALLHSELSPAERAYHWRRACSGEARIVLGTRLAIFTPLPALGLIVLDEEHDASFRQQDNLRYSARDLALVRAQGLKIPVVLGSATPALESWHNAQCGRYRLHQLTVRANPQARLPKMRLLDLRRENPADGVATEIFTAIEQRLARGEQSLLFLNRRGYAPVLACPQCGWVARCPHCSANRVVHLQARQLRCHHCGDVGGLPRACPQCGNQDIFPFGRGTQRLEEMLRQRFPAARLLRVDRDAVKSRRQWLSVLAAIHAGEADILVGTQMLAKGHDFPALTLVAVLGADAALHAAEMRAPEHLFAQLMQVAGRAGRADKQGDVLIQTRFPNHPLFAAVVAQNYPDFAQRELNERQRACFPPFSYQAIIRADAPNLADALAFLQAAQSLPWLKECPEVLLYDPLPMPMTRLAGRERAQLLLESSSRLALQAFLPRWRQDLVTIKTPYTLRWHIEVDPLNI